MRAFIVIFAWATAIGAAARAQQQAADVIPRELVVALLDRYGMSPSPVDIVVARLPKMFPTDALPRTDVRILGGVELGSTATVVAVVAREPDSAAAWVMAHLVRAGWRRAEEERYSGGFVPGVGTRPTVFCRAGAVLSLSARERQNGGSLLHVGIAYPEEHHECATRGQRRAMYEIDAPSLPTLVSPSDARMLSGSAGGGGRGTREASTRLATRRGAADVGAHYAAQLRRAGWTLSPPTHADGVVVYRAKRLDDEKRPLTGALIVLTIPDTNQLDVMFRATRPIPER